MSKRSDKTYPIGSGTDSFGNDVGVYEIMGKGGSMRHRGYFHENNPYLDDVSYATNNKDLDAAYERAVEWDADYETLLEQRAYDRAVLEEQREYDSPLSDMMRKRAAGYNPDIEGASSSAGSGGGSSAQMAQHQMADQSAQSQFKNSYKDREQRLASFSNAVGFIQSISSLLSSVTTGVSTIKQLPSRIALNEAQAKAATASANQSDAVANEINTLLSGKKKLQSVANAQQILSLLSQMQGVLAPDSDISPILSTMGIPTDKHEDFQSAFGELMKTPAVSARTSGERVAAARGSASEQLYTDDYWLKILEKSQTLEELSLDYEAVSLSVQNKIQGFLAASDQYAQSVAEGQVLGAQNEMERQKLFAQEIAADAKAFASLLNQQVQEVRDAESRLAALNEKAKQKGGLNNSEWNEREYLKDAIPMIKTLNSQSMREMFGISKHLRRNKYLSYEVGQGTVNGNTVVLETLDLHFNDLVNGARNANDIAHMWTSSVLDAVGIGVNGYVGYKFSTKPQQLGQTIIDQAPGYDGTMTTTNKRIIQNLY